QPHAPLDTAGAGAIHRAVGVDVCRGHARRVLRGETMPDVRRRGGEFQWSRRLEYRSWRTLRDRRRSRLIDRDGLRERSHACVLELDDVAPRIGLERAKA